LLIIIRPLRSAVVMGIGSSVKWPATNPIIVCATRWPSAAHVLPLPASASYPNWSDHVSRVLFPLFGLVKLISLLQLHYMWLE
jgi:hypothetical protein